MEKYESVIKRPVNRRFLLKSGMLAGGAAVVGARTGLFSGGKLAFGQDSSRGLSKGDVAILRSLAAAELIESDLWTQYAELGGIGDNPPIEVREGSLIAVQPWVRGYLNGWIIADTAQFRILCPEVAFDKLCRSQESKDGDIALGQATAAALTQGKLLTEG